MCIEKYVVPQEIQDLHIQFLGSMDNILQEIKNLSSAKGTPEFEAKRASLVNAYGRADAIIELLLSWHLEKATAWETKRAELSDMCAFYKAISAEK